MASISAGDLRERVAVLVLARTESGDYAWESSWKVWADAQPDTRSNLFSSIGVGARGVTFTIRKSARLTLHHAMLWRGQHCFLTAILPHDHPGYQVVKAALAEPAACRKDADLDPVGCGFPGILTEKYVRHEQPDLHAEVAWDHVLVTPKAVELAPGSWVTVGEAYYRVQAPYLLDPYKNEYEIRRREDC